MNNMLYGDISYGQILSLLPALLVGILAGVVFFAGLWWTVRRGAQSSRPVIWFFGSFLLRSSLTLFAIYWITGGQWPRLLVCLLGFSVARIVVMAITRTATKNVVQQESNHAP